MIRHGHSFGIANQALGLLLATGCAAFAQQTPQAVPGAQQPPLATGAPAESILPLPPVPQLAAFDSTSLPRTSATQLAPAKRDLGGCTSAITAKAAAQCLHTQQMHGEAVTLQAGHEYTLPELIDLAEASSPETRIAWANAKGALERAGITQAQYLPLLTLVAQGSDLRAIVPFPKPIAPRGYVTVEEPTAQEQVELQYKLLDFGRGARLANSRALEIASTLRLGRTQQTVAFRTAQLFYRTQEAIGQLDAVEEIARTAETVQQNAEEQLQNGRATLPDLQNAQAGLAEARYSLASAKGDVQKAKLALTEVLGVEPTTEIDLLAADRDTASDPLDSKVDELLAAAWKQRPDLLARAQQLRSAQQAQRNAHAAYLPTVSLNAAGGHTATWPTADYGQLGFAQVPTWSAAATLRWDIFNGARKHEVRAATAEQDAAVEEQRATKDAVTREVWDAYVNYQTAVEQERSARSFFNAARTSYDSSLDAFHYGVRSLIDVVQAERQLAQARLASVRAYSQRMQSAVSLSYATGDLLHQSVTSAGVQP